MAISVSISTASTIYAAETKILEIADIIEQASSLRRIKDDIKTAEALLRYIRVLQTDSSLTIDEQTAICQHMITIGNLFDFPASPTITTNEIFNFSANVDTGPQGPQGEPGEDGGGTDYNQFTLTSGTNTADTFAVTDADAAEWTYKIKNGSNLRAGHVTAVWLSDGSTVKYTETSTMDIGDTSPVVFSVVYSAGNIILRATIASGTWDINGTRYLIPNNGAGTGVINTVLANGKIFIGNSSSVATAQTVTGDIALSNAGIASITSGVIVDADISSSAAISVTKLGALTADRVVITSGAGILTVSSITPTKLGYLTDVTSNLQAQLDTKVGSAGGAISTVVSTDLTANRAVISNAAGKIAVHPTASDTALGYIATLSSAAQAQIDGKLSTSGGIMTGNISGNSGVDVELTGDGLFTAGNGSFFGGTTGRAAFPGGISTQVAPYTPYWQVKIIQIGDWNMDLTANVSVAHGISDHKKIRSIAASIRDDNDIFYHMLDRAISSSTDGGGVSLWDSTNISLHRLTGGAFDNTSYDSTSYNRGWITITYEV